VLYATGHRFTKQQINVRAPFQNSTDVSGKFCNWSTDDTQIKDHSWIIYIMTNAIYLYLV